MRFFFFSFCTTWFSYVGVQLRHWFVAFFLLCLGIHAAEQVVHPGWLKSSSRDLVLHVQHEQMQPRARRDAGEFVLTVMRELVRGGFTIHISGAFLDEEIAYYEAHVSQERYPDMSRSVLACLKRAKETGSFDWDCLRKISLPDEDPIAIYDYFPWLAPPNDPKRVRIEGAMAPETPRLRLFTAWNGVQVSGSAAIAGREVKGARFREGKGIAEVGEGTKWRFGVAMRLTQEKNVKFEKIYRAEPWRNQPNYYPVAITSLKVMEDIRKGLNFSWDPPPDPKGKKKKAK